MTRYRSWLLGILAIAMGVPVLLMLAQTPTMPSPETAPTNWKSLDATQRLANVHSRRNEDVKSCLQAQGFDFGNPSFIRIMKESSELELWLQPKGSKEFKLYKTWPIARWSGTLGPKTKEGDGQAPEGFYHFTTRQLNPRSNYHLAFNIGYPNVFDQAHQRTGSLIMIHGSNVSIGCFAMTDPVIEEIYLIIEAALKAGQHNIAVHSFPFRMTDGRIATGPAEHRDFWRNLKQGWDLFEKAHVPPTWTVVNQCYHFE